MKKRTILSAGFRVLAGAVVLLRCANPVDEPPLEWRSNVEAPITNERFIIGEELDNLFKFDDLDIINVAWRYYNDPATLEQDTVKGDTVVFSTSNTDSSSFESHEDTLGEKDYHGKIGPIAIRGASDQQTTVPIPAVSGSFSAPVSVTMQQVYTVQFDSTSGTLQVRITNNGGANLEDVVLGIAGVDTADVGEIAAGETEVAELDVAGKTIYNTADFFVGGTTPGDAGMEVLLDYSVNGLVANYLQVNDSLVNFTVEYENAYELTDTIDVNYIDIGEGWFIYAIDNYTGLDLYIQSIHQHMWISSWCEENGLYSIEDLANFDDVDSSNFFGKITAGNSRVEVKANTEQDFSLKNLGTSRLFAEWADSTKTSVTKVKYIVSSGTPVGDTVTLSAEDSLRFVISTSERFKFKEMMGTLTENYERQSDTQKVAINLPWDNSVKDSLRGRFILEQVWGDVLLNPGLPERAFIDTMKIDLIAFSPDSPAVRDSTQVELVNVSRDSSYFRNMDITDVANLYADSIAIAVKVFIPKDTRMRIVNDLTVHDEDYDKYIGRMIVNVRSNFRLNAKLDWTVDGMVNMDLGTSRFEVLEAMRYFGKLEERSATFEMWLSNYSNLNLSLMALAAPDALMDTLDSLPMNDVYLMLMDPELAAENGYVNLFGDTGVAVPKRDTTDTMHNVVLFDDDQLERMFTCDSLNFRWWVQFREQDRDALNDTDFIDMRSRLGISGINNTDSLLIWE